MVRIVYSLGQVADKGGSVGNDDTSSRINRNGYGCVDVVCCFFLHTICMRGSSNAAMKALRTKSRTQWPNVYNDVSRELNDISH